MCQHNLKTPFCKIQLNMPNITFSTQEYAHVKLINT